MNLKTKFFPIRFLLFSFAIALLCLIPAWRVSADGAFFWEREEKLEEPDQKAIIVYDEGVEDLFLQVKYKGKASEFGWIVPVPVAPEIKPVSFYLFDWFEDDAQEKLFRNKLDLLKNCLKFQKRYKYLTKSAGSEVFLDSSREVTVLKKEKIGIYDVAVIKGKDSSSIKKWLEKNKFALPDDAEKVLSFYTDKGWCFVAMKINASFLSNEIQGKMNEGSLDPVHLVFKTDKPVYPLYISSLNAGKTDLLIYLFAKELYASEFFKTKPEEVMDASEFAKEYLSSSSRTFPYVSENIKFYYMSSLPFKIYYERGSHTQPFSWLMTKMVKKIDLASLKGDVLFSKDREMIKSILADYKQILKDKGYEGMANEKRKKIRKKLDFSQRKGIYDSYFFPEPLNGEISREDFKKNLSDYINKEKPNSLWIPLALKRDISIERTHKDVRLWISSGGITKYFADYIIYSGLVDKFLRISDEKEKKDFYGYAKTHLNRYPVIKLAMKEKLKEPLPGIGDFIVFKRKDIHRNMWARFPSEPDFQLYLEMDSHVSDEEALYIQEFYLEKLISSQDPDCSVYLKEWFNKTDPKVRRIPLYIILNSLLARDYVKSTFVRYGRNREQQLDAIRPMLQDKDPECRKIAALIVALLGDDESEEYFAGILKENFECGTWPRELDFKLSMDKVKMFQVAIIAAEKFKSDKYRDIIRKILLRNQRKLFFCDGALIAAVNYIDDPEIRKILARKEVFGMLRKHNRYAYKIFLGIGEELVGNDNSYLKALKRGQGSSRKHEYSFWIRRDFEVRLPKLDDIKGCTVADTMKLYMKMSEYGFIIESFYGIDVIDANHDEVLSILKGEDIELNEALLNCITGTYLKYRTIPKLMQKTVPVLENRMRLERNAANEHRYSEMLEKVYERLIFEDTSMNEDILRKYMKQLPAKSLDSLVCRNILRENGMDDEEVEYGSTNIRDLIPKLKQGKIKLSTLAFCDLYWLKNKEKKELLEYLKKEEFNLDTFLRMFVVYENDTEFSKQVLAELEKDEKQLRTMQGKLLKLRIKNKQSK